MYVVNCSECGVVLSTITSRFSRVGGQMSVCVMLRKMGLDGGDGK